MINNQFYTSKIKVVYFGSFFLGFLYYIIAPLILIPFFKKYQFPLSNKLSYYLDAISFLPYILYSCSLALLVILVWIALDKRYKLKSRCVNYVDINNFLYLFLFFFIMYEFLSIYQLKDLLFKGYLGIKYSERNNYKSFLSGVNLVYLFFTIYFYQIKKNSQSYKVKFLIFFILLSLNSIILLGLGGRMYVLPAFLSFFYMFFLSSSKRIINKKTLKIIIYSVLVLIFILWIGVVRQGQIFNYRNIIFIFSAESAYNWLGAGSALLDNKFGFFNFPIDFIKGIISFIPSVIWPAKYEFMSLIKNTYEIKADVGGTSIIYTLLSNLGYIGTYIFTMIFSVSMYYFYYLSIRSVFYRTFFLCLCSLITFMFYRDSIEIFMKNSIFNIFFIPFIMIFCSKKVVHS